MACLQFVLVTLTLAIVSPLVVVADERWSVTGSVGAAIEERRRRGFDDALFALSVASGYGWSESASVEAELTYVPDLFGFPAERLSVLTVSGVFIRDLRQTGLQPYLAVGGGFGRTRLISSGFENRPLNGPTINLGGGVKVPVRRAVQVRADVRYIAIRDVPDDIRDFWRISAGLTVLLRER
jgi:hypothetical protein